MGEFIYPPKSRQNWKNSFHETFCNVALLAEQPVQVHIRLRPLTDEDICRNSCSLYAVKENDRNALCIRSVNLESPSDNELSIMKDSLYVKKEKANLKTFRFSGLCFAEHMSNVEVYESSIQKAIFNCTEGIHTAVFLLGLKNAGGFHTLAGSNTRPGIIFHALTDIFLMIKCYNNVKSSPFDEFGMTRRKIINKNNRYHFIIRIALIDVFKNNIDSLLTKTKNIKLRQDEIGSPFGRSYSIGDSEWLVVGNMDEAVDLVTRALQKLSTKRKYTDADHEPRASIFLLRVERILVEVKPFSMLHSMFEERTGKFDMDRIIVKERTEGSIAFVLKHVLDPQYSSPKYSEASKPRQVLSVWDILQIFGSYPSRIKNETLESIIETNADPLLNILSPYLLYYGQVIVLLCINPSNFYAEPNYRLLQLGEILSTVWIKVRMWITGWSYQSFYCNWFIKKLYYLKQKLLSFNGARQDSKTLKLYFQQCLSKLLRQVISSQGYAWNSLKLTRSKRLYEAKLLMEYTSKEEENAINKDIESIIVDFKGEGMKNIDVLKSLCKSIHGNSIKAQFSLDDSECEKNLSDSAINAKNNKRDNILSGHPEYEATTWNVDKVQQASESKAFLEQLECDGSKKLLQLMNENPSTITQPPSPKEKNTNQNLSDENSGKILNLNLSDNLVEKKTSPLIPSSHLFENNYKVDANSPDKRKSEKVQNGFEKTSTESIDNCSIKAIKKDPLGFSTTSTSQSKNEICEADANILQTNTNSNISDVKKINEMRDFTFTPNVVDTLSVQDSSNQSCKKKSNKGKKKLKREKRHLNKNQQLDKKSTSSESKIHFKGKKGNEHHKHHRKLEKVNKTLPEIKPTTQHHYAPAGIPYFANFLYPPTPAGVQPISVHLDRHDLDKHYGQQSIASLCDDTEDIASNVAEEVTIEENESQNDRDDFLKENNTNDFNRTSLNIFSVEPKLLEKNNKRNTNHKKIHEQRRKKPKTQKKIHDLRSYPIQKLDTPVISSQISPPNMHEYFQNGSTHSTSALYGSASGSPTQKTSNSIGYLSTSSSDVSTYSYTSSLSTQSRNESTSDASVNGSKSESEQTTKQCFKDRKGEEENGNDINILLDKAFREYSIENNSRIKAAKRRRNVEKIIRLLYYNNHLERFRLTRSTQDLLPFIPDKYKKKFILLMQQISKNKKEISPLKKKNEKFTLRDESDVSSLQNSSPSLTSLETRELLDKIVREQFVGKKHRNAILRGEIGTSEDRFSELMRTQEYKKLRVADLESLLQENNTLVNYSDLLHQEYETFRKDVDRSFDFYRSSNSNRTLKSKRDIMIASKSISKTLECKSSESEGGSSLSEDNGELVTHEEEKEESAETIETDQKTVQDENINTNENIIENEFPNIKISYAGEIIDNNIPQQEGEKIEENLLSIKINNPMSGVDIGKNAYEIKTALISAEDPIPMEVKSENRTHKEALPEQHEKLPTSSDENNSSYSKHSERTIVNYKTLDRFGTNPLPFTESIDKLDEKSQKKLQLLSNSFFPPPNRKKFPPDAGSPLSLHSLCFGGAEASYRHSIFPVCDAECQCTKKENNLENSERNELRSTPEVSFNYTDINKFQQSDEVTQNHLEWKNSLRSYLNVPWKTRAQKKLKSFLRQLHEQNLPKNRENRLKGSIKSHSVNLTNVLRNDNTSRQSQSKPDLTTMDLNPKISRSIIFSSSSDVDSVD